MLLKEALLDILIKLGDGFDIANNEEAAKTVDNMIEDLRNGPSETPPTIEVEIDEDEREEIQRVLEQALESMRGGL